MICRLSQAEPLAVLSFSSFAGMCRARFEKAEKNSLQHIPKGDFGCYRCETGKAISSGALTELPSNVSLINLNEEKTMKNYEVPVRLSPDVLKLKDLASMTVTDIKPYWQGGFPKAKKEGLCPNCLRQMMICAAGLCGRCYRAAAGKEGNELLAALVAISRELAASAAEAKGTGDQVVLGSPVVAGQDGLALELPPGKVEALRPGQGVQQSPTEDDIRMEELEAFWEQITLCLQTSLSFPASTAAVVNTVITLQKKVAKRDMEVAVALEILGQDAFGAPRIGVESLHDACLRVQAERYARGQEHDYTTMAGAIRLECQLLADFLVAKNQSYGDSAANPVRIFSRANSEEQLNVRIDDKISRIRNGRGYPGDNDVLDLLGYLLLFRAVRAHKSAVAAAITEDKEQPIAA